MALAVKNPPDVESASVLDRLPVVALVGVVYVLGCLGVVFYAIPALWWEVLRFPANSIGAGVVLALVMLVAATGLLVFGVRLLGPRAVPGARAGIFTALVGVLGITVLTRWASLWIEHWVYYYGLFGSAGPTAGAIVTAVIALALLGAGIAWLFRKKTEKMLVTFEEQGWFSATSYKGNQGVRVRRGTILGLLVIVVAGIYTLLSHNTLRRGGPNWELNIPFSGVVLVEIPGDVGPHLNLTGRPRETVVEGDKKEELPAVPRYELREINAQFADPNRYVKVTEPGRSDQLRNKEGEVLSKDEFDRAVQAVRTEYKRELDAIRDENERERFEKDILPQSTAPEPATGITRFRSILLLPSVQFSVPLLLLAAGIWLSWRVVNLPLFADFLIATEAELNKVSWTTRKRLFQDTIVVLVTVLLMAGYLFFVDLAWKEVLSWKPIGVLQLPEDEAEKNKSVEQKPW
jgi:preprotein translocase SecE subunit